MPGSATPGRRRRGPSFGIRLARTVLGMVVVAGLGAGARYGYDAVVEARDDADGTEAGSVVPAVGEPFSGEVVDPPDVGAVDLHFHYPAAQDGITDAWVHTPLDGTIAVSEVRLAADPSRAPVLTRFDDRPTGSAAMTVGETDWYVVPGPIGLITSLPESNLPRNAVVTLSDVVPREAIPYVVVEADEPTSLPVAPVAPFAPVGRSGEIAATEQSAPAASTDYATVGRAAGAALPTRHYRLRFDLAAFERFEPIAFAEWVRWAGSAEVVEIWVDENGLVRRWNDGGTVTTLVRAEEHHRIGPPPLIAASTVPTD